MEITYFGTETWFVLCDIQPKNITPARNLYVSHSKPVIVQWIYVDEYVYIYFITEWVSIIKA